MILSKKQEKLLDFVKEQHGDQKRRYTNKPYWTHVYNVAEHTARYEPEGIEAALCHDLLEDTACDRQQLMELLEQINYGKQEATSICNTVEQLTDQFTPEQYPEMNRLTRKAKEAERLGTVGYLAQSIKYADIIDNVLSIARFDEVFGRKYVPEKIDILNQMRGGHIHLLIECCSTIKWAMEKLRI